MQFVMCGEVLQVGLVNKGRCMLVIPESDIAEMLLGAGVVCLGGEGQSSAEWSFCPAEIPVVQVG